MVVNHALPNAGKTNFKKTFGGKYETYVYLTNGDFECVGEDTWVSIATWFPKNYRCTYDLQVILSKIARDLVFDRNGALNKSLFIEAIRGIGHRWLCARKRYEFNVCTDLVLSNQHLFSERTIEHFEELKVRSKEGKINRTEHLILNVLCENLPELKQNQQKFSELAKRITEQLSHKASLEDLKQCETRVVEKVVDEVVAKVMNEVKDFLDSKYLSADEVHDLIKDAKSEAPRGKSSHQGMMASLKRGISNFFTSTIDPEKQDAQCKNADAGVIIFVNNLDDMINDDLLEQSFSSFGSIASASVIRDFQGASLGFGFIRYSKLDEPSLSLEKMNRIVLRGKLLSVSKDLNEIKGDVIGKKFWRRGELCTVVSVNELTHLPSCSVQIKSSGQTVETEFHLLCKFGPTQPTIPTTSLYKLNKSLKMGRDYQNQYQKRREQHQNTFSNTNPFLCSRLNRPHINSATTTGNTNVQF